MENMPIPSETKPHADRRRRAALLVLVLCAVVSLGLMFWAGHRQSSVILMLLFAGWVGAPFAGMTLLYSRAKRWPLVRQNVIYNEICVISAGSVFLYTLANLKHFSKAAGPFLVVPAATWVLMVIWFWLTRSFHGRVGGEVTAPNLGGKR